MIEEEKAKSIISRLQRPDYNVSAIAASHGVSYHCVYSILTGRTWGDLTRGGSVFSGHRRQRSKVTDDDAERIRSLHAGGTRQSDIAAMFDVSQACISRIVNHQSHQ